MAKVNSDLRVAGRIKHSLPLKDICLALSRRVPNRTADSQMGISQGQV